MDKLIRYTKADVIGPGNWFMLHLVSYLASNRLEGVDRDTIDSLVEHIKKNFPCDECKGHFNNMMREHPLIESNTKDLFEAVFFCHKRVNDRLKKQTPLFRYVNEWFDALVNDKRLPPTLHQFTNADRVGPGIWWVLHSTSHHNIALFEKLFKLLLKYFPCVTCREHMNEYNMVTPLASYGRSNYPTYMWSFHDDVDTKLSKESVPIEIVLKFFKDSESCKKGCTSDSQNDTHHYGSYVGY